MFYYHFLDKVMQALGLNEEIHNRSRLSLSLSASEIIFSSTISNLVKGAKFFWTVSHVKNKSFAMKECNNKLIDIMSQTIHADTTRK